MPSPSLQALRVVLPWHDALGLFSVRPPGIDLSALVPTEGFRRARLCEAGRHLLVLDRDGSRLRVFEIDEAGQPRPLALPDVPSGARFDDALMVQEVLFAGGVVGREPALWSGEPCPGEWDRLDLPALDCAAGKSFDFLFHHDGDLIAVDDYVLPHWCLVWDIVEPQEPRHLATVALPAHTTREHVHFAACGDRYLALHSAGVNHGTRSWHLSILRAEGLRELACYRAEIRPGQAAQASAPAHLGALPGVQALAFAGDLLFAALGSGGLLRLDLRGPPLPRTRRPGPAWVESRAEEGPAPTVREVPGLAMACHLAPVGTEGVFVTGWSHQGEERAVWVPVETP